MMDFSADFSEDDHKFMTQALSLALQGIGRTWPNPSVGCVVVKNGVVVGQGRTANGGRPHAETQALAMAGDKARGATIYVTLEPCNTHGKTPPCVDALIAAGVTRVVIACPDPYQARQSGKGVERLMQAGVRVEAGLLSNKALTVNEGFFFRVVGSRPFIAAKLATTLDGRIATKSGESKWITGEAARKRGHEIRALHDAVVVGIGTVLADDPLLTVRLDGEDRKPVRVVIDRDLKISPESKLVSTAQDSPVWIVCSARADEAKAAILEQAGIKLLRLPHDQADIIPALAIAEALAAEGLTRVMIEGGGRTIAEFLKAELVDQFFWFRAPVLMGGDGIPGVHALGVENLSGMTHLTFEHSERLGDDFLDVWRRKERAA